MEVSGNKGIRVIKFDIRSQADCSKYNASHRFQIIKRDISLDKYTGKALTRIVCLNLVGRETK